MASSAEIRSEIQTALRVHARELRRIAARRTNAGPGNADYRARLRAQATLATDLAQAVDGTHPVTLAAALGLM